MLSVKERLKSLKKTVRAERDKERSYSPEMLLALGFLGFIVAGTVLLQLPIAARSGHSIGWFNSLFTATSAVCVTGLVAVDTGTTFSVFGQIVLLLLIQIGGLGFMVFATRALSMLGRRVSLKGRMLIRETMNSDSMTDLGGLSRRYLKLALGIEAVGAAVLAIRFIPIHGPRRGLWFSIFHAVSAFCNAGFDLFGDFSSLTQFSGDPLVLLTVSALIVLGGLGFSVIVETLRNRNGFRALSLHTRIVLVLSPALIVAGTIFYLLAERGHIDLLNAFFQSVTMRTAGFNSVDLGAIRDGSKLFSSMLMVIGASTASTGGGMKTTTVAVLAALIFSVIKGEHEVNFFKRRLSTDTVHRALVIVVMYVVLLGVSTMLITLIEDGRFDLDNILFECASAMGTVGVSSIGTPHLSILSRALLIPMMFLGRLGPLSMAMALANRQGRPTIRAAKYPEEKIMIG